MTKTAQSRLDDLDRSEIATIVNALDDSRTMDEIEAFDFLGEVIVTDILVPQALFKTDDVRAVNRDALKDRADEMAHLLIDTHKRYLMLTGCMWENARLADGRRKLVCTPIN